MSSQNQSKMLTFTGDTSLVKALQCISEIVPSGWVIGSHTVLPSGDLAVRFDAPEASSRIPSPEIAAQLEQESTDRLLSRIDMLTEKWKECAIENEGLRKRLMNHEPVKTNPSHVQQHDAQELANAREMVEIYANKSGDLEKRLMVARAELAAEREKINLLQSMLQATNEARAKCEYADRKKIQELERDLKYTQDANSELCSQLNAMKASNDHNIYVARVLENRLQEIRAALNRPPDGSASTATAGR